ncbi:MAG: nucleotide exchange factor GrpE [Candidatus Melainabacteria bacterium GWF2_37_15]|nr:MAG: nucleotide exchange factor GrpE [Candidatus Melainabacteria bacterium GWF2_37_15]
MSEKEENPFVQENNAEETEQNEQTETDDKIKKLEEEIETQKNQYVRLAADFDNYRKRQAQEREALLKYGAEETLKKLLPVLDTVERAQKSFQELDDPTKLKESFDAIQKQIIDALDKIGLKKIESVGKEFDPNLHEAIMQTPANGHPDHTVIAELQSGYQLHDRIVRPAMVNVAVKE